MELGEDRGEESDGFPLGEVIEGIFLQLEFGLAMLELENTLGSSVGSRLVLDLGAPEERIDDAVSDVVLLQALHHLVGGRSLTWATSTGLRSTKLAPAGFLVDDDLVHRRGPLGELLPTLGLLG